MRRLLPSRVELMIFAALAVFCATVVSVFKVDMHDLGFAMLGGPIFLVAAVMGLRRSPVWMAEEADEDAE
jgi:hypothetical protein